MGRSGLERLAAPADWGGQGLPHAVNAACIEMWNSASMAFGIGPVLTMAAIDALHVYGSDALKKEYLAKLISGEWMAPCSSLSRKLDRMSGPAQQGRARKRRRIPHYGSKSSSPMVSTT